MNKFFCLMFLLPSLLMAQENEQIDWDRFILNSPMFVMYPSLQESGQTQVGQPEVVDTSEGFKSVKKAFLFSAIVPGTGEMYSGSFLKGVAFLAIEIGAWSVHTVYSNEGKDIENEFRGYADEHWIEDHYWDYVAQYSQINRDDMDALREWEHSRFSHGLHVDKDQQYYEMIGKYDQFNFGWDDTDKGLLDADWDTSLRSSRRLYYEGRRNASNTAFKKATWGSMIALFNHALSAVDAAWTAYRNNKKIAEASIQMQPIQYGYERVPAVSLKIEW